MPPAHLAMVEIMPESCLIPAATTNHQHTVSDIYIKLKHVSLQTEYKLLPNFMLSSLTWLKQGYKKQSKTKTERLSEARFHACMP